MSNIETIIEHAEQYCIEHGSRLTDKRKQVLSGLLQSEKALSAYELVDYCREEFGENMPAMSVYRILDFLEGEKLIHKLNLANKFIACAHITCRHEHGVPQFLICGKCKKVKEISIDHLSMQTIEDNVKQAGFHLVSPQLEMNCICEDCMLGT